MAADTALFALERNWQMVDSAVADMDEATMSGRPNDQCNSISWLLWHMTRVADNFIHLRFRETQPLWVTGGWHQRFGMDSDPGNFGMGWTSDQVGAWRPPSKDVQLGYFEAVKSAVRSYLQPLSEKDMAREMPFPAPPNTLPLSNVLGVMIMDNIVHGGQIAYLKGYYQGMGWFR